MPRLLCPQPGESVFHIARIRRLCLPLPRRYDGIRRGDSGVVGSQGRAQGFDGTERPRKTIVRSHGIEWRPCLSLKKGMRGLPERRHHLPYPTRFRKDWWRDVAIWLPEFDAAVVLQ